MKIKKLLFFFAAMAAVVFSSCSDSASYADLLNDERPILRKRLIQPDAAAEINICLTCD